MEFRRSESLCQSVRIAALLVALVLPLSASALDADGDGIIDGLDNCRLSSNASQNDSNSDGYGISSFEHAVVSAAPTTSFDPVNNRNWRLGVIQFTVTGNVAADGADVEVNFDEAGVDGVWNDGNVKISAGTALGTLTVNP